MPVIELYPNEHRCEFVYTDSVYEAWLAAAREPLRSASVLAHDGGICRGEILALQRDCVNLLDKADSRGFWGTIESNAGLNEPLGGGILITQTWPQCFSGCWWSPGASMCLPVCMTTGSRSP